MTAVAVGSGYECHRCGAVASAGLVRVPRAWGSGGEAMAEAAALPLSFPEASIVVCDSLEEQTAAIARGLPQRPLVLGCCCCAHTGAIKGLAARGGRLAVIWLDAHGDLNTPESSPSGNAWGMPLRVALDEGMVDVSRVALVGARNLDPPEAEFIAAAGIDDDVERALTTADGVYVALDADVLAPGEISCFMPEPGGPSVDEAVALLQRLAACGTPLAGMGLTGLRPDADPAALTRITTAVGL